MIRELKIAVSASGKEAQYDEHAKNIAGQKFIIANILAKSVEAFRGMKPKDIIPYIEGEPYISKVPVEPGLTNATREENGQRVVGLNTENQEINEGLVRFDVICYVRLPERDGEKVPDGEKKPLTQIIINLEMQKDQPREYQILNRAVFYVSRQISAQKERDLYGLPLRRYQECVLYLDLHEYGGKQHEPYSPDKRGYDGKPAVEGRTGFVPYRYDWDWKRPARPGRKL